MASYDPLIGKQIGNYRILAKINSGSFGNVYQGKHVIFEDEPVVAIKLLHTAFHSPQEDDEFIKEARVLKKLNHPRILRILDAGLQDGVPFLVTEYAAGGSLRDRLKQSNGWPLPVDEATNILTQIGQALHYAHERRIIHRDLKPANILFNAQGEIVLADFGIAVTLASNHTGRVGIGGTFPYMAPEQFEGLASPRSDQYSLGCIAYELVTGHQLYSIPDPSLQAYWFHHAKVEITTPRHYNPQLPIHIERVIVTALAKDRSHRHQDISTFCEGLLKSQIKQNYPQQCVELIQQAKQQTIAQNLPSALLMVEQALRIEPTFLDALTLKTQILGVTSRFTEAMAVNQQLLQLEPANALSWSLNAALLANTGRFQEALESIEHSLAIQPDDPEALAIQETIKAILLNQ